MHVVCDTRARGSLWMVIIVVYCLVMSMCCCCAHERLFRVLFHNKKYAIPDDCAVKNRNASD